MWKQLKDTIYFLFFDLSDGYSVSVTDFYSIWNKHFNEECLVNEAKKSNKCLKNINPEELKNNIIDMLLNPDKMSSVIIKENKLLLLTLSSKQYGYPLHFHVGLLKGTNQQFFQEITQPLLLTIHDLKSSEDELRKQLIKKDEEIKAYKARCTVNKVAEYLKTSMYNDEMHLKKHTVYKDVFNKDSIPLYLLNIQGPTCHGSNLAQEELRITVTGNTAPLDSAVKNPHIIKTEPSDVNTEADSPAVHVKQEVVPQHFEQRKHTNNIMEENELTTCNDEPNKATESLSSEVHLYNSEVKIIPNDQGINSEQTVVKQESEGVLVSDKTRNNVNIKREQTESQTFAVSARKKRKGLNF